MRTHQSPHSAGQIWRDVSATCLTLLAPEIQIDFMVPQLHKELCLSPWSVGSLHFVATVSAARAQGRVRHEAVRGVAKDFPNGTRRQDNPCTTRVVRTIGFSLADLRPMLCRILYPDKIAGCTLLYLCHPRRQVDTSAYPASLVIAQRNVPRLNVNASTTSRFSGLSRFYFPEIENSASAFIRSE